MQGSFHSFICVSPGFHIGLCPHFSLGFAGVPPLQGSLSDWLRVPRVSYRALPLFHPGLCRSVDLTGLFSFFYLRLPRVSYRALPLFHPGLCRSAALAGLIVGLSVFTQGSISGFALIPPWAMQECRPYRALFILLSAFTQGSISGFVLIPPWALQECRPCRALFILLSAFTQGFISGFALISPWAMQECRPYRAFCRIGRLRSCVVVLCSLNVFGCVNGLLRSFVFLFDCDCMGCGGGLFGGIVGAVGQ